MHHFAVNVAGDAELTCLIVAKDRFDQIREFKSNQNSDFFKKNDHNISMV